MSDEFDTFAISTFKAACLAVFERVRRTGRLVLVTHRGGLVAGVVPPSLRKPTAPWIGSVDRLRGSAPWIGSVTGEARVVGDLVDPLAPPEAWEAPRL